MSIKTVGRFRDLGLSANEMAITTLFLVRTYSRNICYCSECQSSSQGLAQQLTRMQQGELFQSWAKTRLFPRQKVFLHQTSNPNININTYRQT